MRKIIHLALLAGLTFGVPLALQPAFSAADVKAQCMEDDPCWSCVDMGDRQCGPTNTNHVPAGCYDDGGVLYAPWPCKPWKPSDGYRHPDGSVTYPDSCQIELYTGEIDCSGAPHGADWDTNPNSYLATGPNAYDEGAYVGGYN